MSYSHRPGNKLRSHLTGKEYPFVKDRDGRSKREAVAKLTADDTSVRAANNERAAPVLNRELTETEHRTGNWIPDTRTTKEKVAQDAVHKSQPKHDPDRNHHAEYAAELETKLSRATAREKPGIQRRLDILRQSAAEFDTRLAERKSREAHRSSPAFTDAVVYGQAWIARLETNGSIPQEWVDGARARIEALNLTGDVDAFWKANDAFEAERQTTLKQKTAALDAEAAAVRAEAAAVSREAKAELAPAEAPAEATAPEMVTA